MPIATAFIMANRGGIPRIEATGVSVGSDSVVFSFKPHPFLNMNFAGLVLFKLPSYTAPTTSVPVVFDTNGNSKNLTTLAGANVTSSDLNSFGIYLAYYDGSTLQLLTGL